MKFVVTQQAELLNKGDGRPLRLLTFRELIFFNQCRGAISKSSRAVEDEGFDDGRGRKGQIAEAHQALAFMIDELVAAAKSAGLSPWMSVSVEGYD